MCQPGSRIKFCTCAPDEPLPYPRWELWRSRPDRDMLERFIVGEIVPPSLDHELLVERVLQDLNQPDAFDTDLDFRDGDSLVLHWREDDAMHFRFHNETWLGSWGAGFGNPTQTTPSAAGRIERHRRQDFETSDW